MLGIALVYVVVATRQWLWLVSGVTLGLIATELLAWVLVGRAAAGEQIG